MNQVKKMGKVLIVPQKIVCADEENKILQKTALEITDNKISDFISFEKINMYS